MTKLCLALAALVLGFTASAQAQYVPAPNIYAPSYGTGTYSPPPHTWDRQIGNPSSFNSVPEQWRTFAPPPRPCVPAAGDRC